MTKPATMLTKRKYKNVPEDWKSIPESRFLQAIAHIEAVLLDISPDGRLDASPADGLRTIPKLNLWATHLRRALKELTRGA